MDFSVFSLGTRHTTLGTRDSGKGRGMTTGKDQSDEWGFLKNREWTERKGVEINLNSH
jgi:hypothetical protein